MRNLLRNQGNNVVATYDYFDIAEGTGIKKFVPYYYLNSNQSGAILTANPYNISKEIYRENVSYVSNATLVKISEISMDMPPFNYQKIINGKTFIQADWVLGVNSNTIGQGKMFSGMILLTLSKVKQDNSVINLASTSSAVQYVYYGGTVNGYSTIRELIKIDVPQTTFKPKESIRIYFAGYGSIALSGGAGGSVSISMGLMYNPVSFAVYVPFKIDI